MVINIAVLTVHQIILLLLPLAIAVFILNQINRANGRLIIKRFGYPTYLCFAFPGTIFHELSHAVMAVLFNHRITDIELLSPDPNTGSFGYVGHSWNSRSIYQSAGNFFIGIAPLISGVVIVCIANQLYSRVGVKIEAGNVQFQLVGRDFLEIVAIILSASVMKMYHLFSIDHLKNIFFWSYLVFGFFISGAVAPSWADVKNSALGIMTLAVVLFGANGVCFLLEVNEHVLYGRYINTITTKAIDITVSLIAINVILLVIMALLSGIMAVLRKTRSGPA